MPLKIEDSATFLPYDSEHREVRKFVLRCAQEEELFCR
jgi:hypothetical protein